jgi:hypothetical protein
MPAQTQKCCWYCRLSGHNIRTCNSESLIQFERKCIDILREIAAGNPFVPSLRSFILLEHSIYYKTPFGFAIKKCGAKRNDTLDECINRILYYFSRLHPLYYENLPSGNAVILNNLFLPHLLEIEYNNIYENILLRMGIDLQEFMRARPIERFTFPGITIINDIFIERPMTTYNKCKMTIEDRIHTEPNLETECEICYETCSIDQFITFNCQHNLCKKCFIQTLLNTNKTILKCPFCRSDIQKIQICNENVKKEIEPIIDVIQPINVLDS